MKNYQIKYQKLDLKHGGNIITDWIEENYEYYYEAFGRFILLMQDTDIINMLLLNQISKREERIILAYADPLGGEIKISQSEFEVYTEEKQN